MKKLIAIILVISILFSVGVAFAEEDSPVDDSANIEEQTLDEITDNGESEQDEPDMDDVLEDFVIQEESIESPFDSMELSEIVKTNDADIIADAIVHFVIDSNENDKAKQLYDMALEAEISFSEINIASIAKALMLDEQSDLLANGTDAKDNSDEMLNSAKRESDVVAVRDDFLGGAQDINFYYLDENGEKVMIYPDTVLYRNTKVYCDNPYDERFDVKINNTGEHFEIQTSNDGHFDTGNSVYTCFTYFKNYMLYLNKVSMPEEKGFHVAGSADLLKNGDFIQTKPISLVDKTGRDISFVVNDGKNDITIEKDNSFNPNGAGYIVKKMDVDNAKIYLEPREVPGGYYFCKEGSEDPDIDKNISIGTVIGKNSTICRVNESGRKISFKIDGKTTAPGVFSTGDKRYLLFDSENLKSCETGFIVKAKNYDDKDSYVYLPLTKGMTVNMHSTINCVNDKGKKVEFRVNIGNTKHNIKIFSYDTYKTVYQVENIDMDGEVPVISLTEPSKPKQYGFYFTNNIAENPSEFIEEGMIIRKDTPISCLTKNGLIGHFVVDDGQTKEKINTYGIYYPKKAYFVKKIDADGQRIYLEADDIAGVYMCKPGASKPDVFTGKIEVGSLIDKNTKICRVNKEGEILGVVLDGKNVQAPFDTGNNYYYLQSEFSVKQYTSGFYAVNNDKPVFDRKMNAGQTLKPGDAICYVDENGQRADYMVDCFNGETTTLKKNECYDISDTYVVKNIGTHAKTGLPAIYIGYKMCFKGINYSEIKEETVIRKSTSFYSTDDKNNKIMFKVSTDGGPLQSYNGDFKAGNAYKVKKIDYSRRNPEIYLETADNVTVGFYVINGDNPDYSRPVLEGDIVHPGVVICQVNENNERRIFKVVSHVVPPFMCHLYVVQDCRYACVQSIWDFDNFSIISLLLQQD